MIAPIVCFVCLLAVPFVVARQEKPQAATIYVYILGCMFSLMAFAAYLNQS